MGRALERLSRPEEARRCYRLAAPGRMGAQASAALAHSYRRAGEREQAAAVWREMIEARRGGAAPYIELAKYEEHVRKNPRGALELTERAIILLQEERLRPDASVQEIQNELQYRRRRLKRRLESREGAERPPEKEQGGEGAGETRKEPRRDS